MKTIFMKYLRHNFRAILVWGLIPWTLIATRPVAGCVCSDGHFEPFCNGKSCCSEKIKGANAGVSTARSCCRRSKQVVNSKRKCCQRRANTTELPACSEVSDGNCCHPVGNVPLVIAKIISLESSPELPVFAKIVAPTLIPAVREWSFPPFCVDTGPPIERLSQLQRWLI